MASESNGVHALMHKFLGLLRNYREPVTDAEVREYFQAEGQGEYEKLPSVLNVLMSEVRNHQTKHAALDDCMSWVPAGKIKIFQKGNVLSYGVIGAEEAERIRGLTLEQRLVLQEIERAGNKGIWTRDIKTHTNIPQQIVTKTLRLLETRRLVKSVKSISSKNKKLYMLFDLVPSTEITGGPWYNEQEFDHVFIDTLSTFVYEVIKASGTSTLNAITDKVHASGISKVALGPEEIRSIIQTLMYDGRVEEVRAVRLTPGASHETKYKVSHDISTFNYLSETPCGVCPNLMDRHQHQHVQEAAAPPPPRSLMRINAAAVSATTSSSSAGRRPPSSSSSAQVLASTRSAAFASSAGPHHEARERIYPMTPVLTASFPSQQQGMDSDRSSADAAVYPHSSNGLSSSTSRLRLGQERHAPQWFTAAPLLSQFYSQTATSQSQTQHQLGHTPGASFSTATRRMSVAQHEHYRSPNGFPSMESIQRQRQSHSHAPHTEENPPALPSPEQLQPRPGKKRKKTAFRLRNFLCMHPGCGKSFTDNAHLRDHTFVHTGEKNLSCAVCGKKFARLSTLHDHQRVHSGERPYSCSYPGCAKRYSSRAALRFHVAGHASAGSSGTAIRNFNYSAMSTTGIRGEARSESCTAPQMARHDSQTSPLLTARLQTQQRESSNPTAATASTETHRLHVKIRTQETQIAELQAELQKLKRKANKSSASNAQSATALAPPMIAPVVYLMDGMKPFQCFVCYRRFANYYQLSFHGKQHPDASVADVARNQEPLPVGPKYCPESDCEYGEKSGKPLKNLQTLKRHWQRRHQLARPYVCATCSPENPKSFKTKENLKAHEKDCKGGSGGSRAGTTHS